jgi:hypothetical protein
MSKNRTKFIAISVLLGFIVFIGIAIVTKLFSSADLPVQISGALLEAVVTALITYFLLTGQTQSEESKERNMKVFEKKQEVYHNFLDNLKTIVQDGEIKIGVKNEEGKIDRTVDELKDLIFQLGYLQMHTSETTINGILDELAKMIQCLNDYNSTEEQKKQETMPNFYSSFSESLFKIVSTLKSDLYGQESNTIAKEKMNDILKECNLFVETKDFNKKELQNYFWEELRKQLKGKGYKIDTEKNFTPDINEYYARARNRHRYYGFTFEVFKLQDNTPVNFKVEVDNEYLYGFPRGEYKKENETISKVIDKMTGFAKSDWWFGWKFSSEYRLDFWNLNSNGFAVLKDPRKREKYIEGITTEIDMYIKEFQKIAKEKNVL